MKRLLYTVISVLLFVSSPGFSETGTEEDKAKRELSPEELETSMGRMGEVETIPEGFSFSDAETKLWFAEHLSNIDRPVRLYYEFVKSGTYEEGFTDAVYLDIIKINDDGTKNAVLDFFTAARKQVVSPENVTNIGGNPVLAIFMQGDVYEMNRLTEGHWRHFQKMIKIALRENASVEPVSINFNGKKVSGDKISFSPYMNDPHKSDYEQFAQKTYEFILSEDVPGTLYQIRTIIRNPTEPDKAPLMEETLTLIETTYKS